MLKMFWSVIPKYIIEYVLLKKLNFLRVKNQTRLDEILNITANTNTKIKQILKQFEKKIEKPTNQPRRDRHPQINTL